MSDRVRSYASDSAMHSPMAVQPVDDRLVVELAGRGERRQLRPVADLVGEPAAVRPRSAGRAATRASACCARPAGGPGRPVEVGGLGPQVVERVLTGGVAGHDPPALRSVPASVSSRARPSAKIHRACPPGLGRLLLVDLEPPALHQVNDEGHRLEPHEQVLARRPTPPAGARRRRRGGVGLQRGERERPEAAQLVAPKSSVRRSAWAWTSGISGTVPPRVLGGSVSTSWRRTAASVVHGGEGALVGDQQRQVAADAQPALDERPLRPSPRATAAATG